MKDKKNLLIAILLFAVVAMGAGYAALSATLTTNDASTIGDWDVEIVSIEGTYLGEAKDKTEPIFTAATATFDASLSGKEDAVTYTITIENKGSIDAKLSSITLTPQTQKNSPVKYTIDSQPAYNEVLTAGSTATVVITAEYDSTFTGELTTSNKSRTITSIFEYVQDK